MIFYTEPKKLKKKIRSLTIADSLIRAIAMFFSFVLADKAHSKSDFVIGFSLLILMFLCNVYVEFLLLNRLKENNKIKYSEDELSEKDYANIARNVNIKEFIFLFLLVLLIIGIRSKDLLVYISFYVIPFVILLYLYIKESYKSLSNYYIDKEKVKLNFWIENTSVFLMLVLYIIYKIVFTNMPEEINFILNVIFWSFTAPKFLALRKRKA